MSPDAPMPGSRQGLPVRALALGCFLLVLVAVVAFYVEVAWGKVDQFSTGVPAMAPVVLLVMLTGLARTRLLRRVRLTRRELLTIYCLLLVGGPMVSRAVLVWMLPMSIVYQYTARAQPEWEAIFLRDVPSWFAPSSQSAVEGFFLGQAHVPWLLWAAPLAAWLGFMLCLFLATTCILSLLQHQWIANERLSFPIAQIPLELVSGSEGRRDDEPGRLPTAWPFWLGGIATLAISFMNSLSLRLPAIPAIPMGPTPLMRWQNVGPIAGLGEIDLVLWPWLTAIAFIIPKELSFSAWFFWLLRLGLSVIAIAAGATPQRPEDMGWSSSFPAAHYQAGGAVLALGLWTCWGARRHISRAFRIAFSPLSGRADADEPMPYRLALLGFALSFGFMLWLCWLAGCRLAFGVVLISSILVYYVIWARLRAETGLGFLIFPIEIQEGMTYPFGGGILRSREIIMLMSSRWAYYGGGGDSVDVCTGNALDAFKIADAAGMNRRALTGAMLGAFLLSLLVGTYVVLTGIYHYGFFALDAGGASEWPSFQLRTGGERIVSMLTNPSKADPRGVLAIGAGVAVTAALAALRLRFWWWPFHPVGYLAANCWGMQLYYMPFFIGWAAKSLVIRYGGLRLYRRAVPLAIGCIVGDLLNRGVWAVIALATGGHV